MSLFQKWTLIGLFAAITPIVFWLRAITKSHADFEVAYLLSPLSSLAIVSFIVIRGIRRIYQLRIRYRESCTERMKGKWSAEALHEFPPDPTLEFLGDKWWKLPAAVTAVVSGELVVLELFGVTDMLVQLL